MTQKWSRAVLRGLGVVMPSRLPDRSERLLMRHAADRLSVMWYMGYDLNESLPGHSSLTRIRERYGVDVFRRFAGGDCGAVPASGTDLGEGTLHRFQASVQANASRDSVKPRFAVEVHLSMLFSEQAEEATGEAE